MLLEKRLLKTQNIEETFKTSILYLALYNYVTDGELIKSLSLHQQETAQSESHASGSSPHLVRPVLRQTRLPPIISTTKLPVVAYVAYVASHKVWQLSIATGIR